MNHGKVFTLMLAVFFGGCTASSPSTQPASSVVPDVTGPLVASNNLTAGQPIPKARGEDLTAKSLCTTDEAVLFSCAIEGGGKMVSLCASKDVAEKEGYLYYAYGIREERELVFPADRQPPAKRFHRTPLGFAGSTGGYAYSFENAGYKYIVYSISGERGLEDQGVMVMRGNIRKPQAVMPCKASSVIESDSDALLDLTLEWDRDTAIDDHGLPARN